MKKFIFIALFFLSLADVFSQCVTTNTFVNIDICEGDSLFLQGTYRVGSSGPWFDTVASVDFCDSVLISILHLIPTERTSLTIDLCEGDSVLHSATYHTAPAFLYDTLTSIRMCDSIIETELVLLPVYTTSINQDICEGDSVLHSGVYYSGTDIFYDTLTSVLLCDSIIETVLNEIPTLRTVDSIEVCAGEYKYLEGWYRGAPSGPWVDTLSSVSSCDSIVETYLILVAEKKVSVTQYLCASDSVLHSGSYYSAPNVLTDTLSSIYLCDSIIETVLSLFPVDTTRMNQYICFGDSVLHFGTYYKAPVFLYDTLVSSNMCDSIIETALLAFPSDTATFHYNLCEGQGMNIAGTYRTSPSGPWYIYTNSINGCDSLKEIYLFALPKDTIIEVSICEGESHLIDNNSYTEAGAYAYHTENIYGCDSIVTTNLTVVPKPVVDAGVDQSFCTIQPVLVVGIVTGGFTTGSWTTRGTGSFSMGSGTTITYLPSSDDEINKSVSLILTSTNNNICTPVSDSILVMFDQADLQVITGTVFYQGSPTTSGEVRLISKDGNGPLDILEVDKVNLDSDGNFLFTEVINGTYLIKALGDTAIYKNVATYYNATEHWGEATEIVLNNDCNDTLFGSNVDLIDYENNNGEGKIYGRIVRGSSNLDDDPVSGVNITLKDFSTGIISDAKISNNGGVFIFPSIKNGDYYLDADLMGYEMESFESLTFADWNNDYIITICVNDSLASISLCSQFVNSISTYEVPNVFEVFPNPSSDVVIVKFISDKMYDIQLVDINGKIVYTASEKSTDSTIDVSVFDSGIYTVSIYSEDVYYHQKLIIR
jgi:hypothetical protein